MLMSIEQSHIDKLQELFVKKYEQITLGQQFVSIVKNKIVTNFSKHQKWIEYIDRQKFEIVPDKYGYSLFNNFVYLKNPSGSKFRIGIPIETAEKILLLGQFPP